MCRWLIAGMCMAVLAVAVGCGGGGDTGNCDTDPTWAACVQPLMAASCSNVGCHDGNGGGAGLDLTVTDPSTVIAATPTTSGSDFKMVVAGKPDESAFYLKLLDDSARPAAAQGKVQGSKMPLGGSFSAANIATVKLWIEKGAK